MSRNVKRLRDDTHHRHDMALDKWAGILLLSLWLCSFLQYFCTSFFHSRIVAPISGPIFAYASTSLSDFKLLASGLHICMHLALLSGSRTCTHTATSRMAWVTMVKPMVVYKVRYINALNRWANSGNPWQIQQNDWLTNVRQRDVHFDRCCLKMIKILRGVAGNIHVFLVKSATSLRTYVLEELSENLLKELIL